MYKTIVEIENLTLKIDFKLEPRFLGWIKENLYQVKIYGIYLSDNDKNLLHIIDKNTINKIQNIIFEKREDEWN